MEREIERERERERERDGPVGLLVAGREERPAGFRRPSRPKKKRERE
jgi:hypothetical protein